MPTIVVETRIAASIDVCFDLARDVETHLATSSFTDERAVGGVTAGLLNLGDVVTFEGVHLGIRQRLTAKIVEFDPPHRFVSQMVKGAFSRMRHVHEFTAEGSVVVMRDRLTWRSPFWLLGTVADIVLVERHMKQFLVRKQRALKERAERMSVPNPHR